MVFTIETENELMPEKTILNIVGARNPIRSPKGSPAPLAVHGFFWTF
jgi:hypothetical protein